MGLVCNKSGLQFGISTKPFSYRNTGSKMFGHYCWRSKYFIKIKCNRTRSFEPNSNMFLRYRLHGTQNEWENETCHNSEISKMLSPEKEHFKMDTLSKGLNLIKSKDWTIIIDLSDAYLQVQFSKKYKQYLWFLNSMENTLFRAHRCTQSFHEHCFYNSSIITVSEHQNNGLFRRLVSSKSVTQILSSRSIKNVSICWFLWGL